ISPGSKLAAVVGSGGFVRVNSRHHQGIKEPQKSSELLASAYSLEDGYIEALESPGHRWVIGVQFHPERRMEVPPHFDRLFQSLVERAAEGVRAAQ
ncbi:MAG: gamma-glutamyl-gamma-aminobutyrate hydrolase family protein, partial [Chloroflexi bacterium]|nr:gamma-glutamyl-gamma-aminobutyrate hydrolase family protein [Chloroflexota bacterium]